MRDLETITHYQGLLNKQTTLIFILTVAILIISAIWSTMHNNLRKKYELLQSKYDKIINTSLNINEYIISNDIDSIVIKYRNNKSKEEKINETI